MFEPDTACIASNVHVCRSVSVLKSDFECFTSFEFLSTTVHHGNIIQRENIFIVNNIDKFNVSRF